MFVDYCDETVRTVGWQSGDDPNKVLETDDGPETDDSSFKHTGFTMDLGCPHTFDSVIIKNSHNAEKRDKSSKLINIKGKNSPNFVFNDPISGSISLADARYLQDPLPLEEYELDETVTDKQYVGVVLKEVWGYNGAWAGGKVGIDYFDIVRKDPSKVLDDAKEACQPKSGNCKPKALFCSHTNCIPDSIWWQDENNLNYQQKGCSMIGQDVMFQNSAKCVKKDTLEGLSPPFIIDTTDASLMEECTAWTDTEACDKKILTLVDIGNIGDASVLTNMFQVTDADDCSGGGVKIEAVDTTGMSPSGDFLSYLDMVNSTLELGDEEQCFTLVHGLCGPDSISLKSPGNLFVTFCDNTIIMKEEYDHCG